MIQTKITTFDDANRRKMIAIRTRVFHIEQGVESSIDFDDQDNQAQHCLVFVNGVAVATGRILNDGHIGRIAVLSSHRGVGLGKLVVNTLINFAQNQGYARVYLGSQLHAMSFYQALGFTPYGNEYTEANIRHRLMAMDLSLS